MDSLLYTSLATAALALAAPIPFYLRPPKRTLRRGPVSAGAPGELEVGAAKNVLYAGRPAVVIRTEEEFRAFSRICSHRNCSVNWEQDHFLCPCHGARFDTNGNPTEGPAKKPLESIPCAVKKGEIILGG